MNRNERHLNGVSVTALVAVLLLAIGGCGGGGGSESGPGTVAVTLTNALGEPSAGVDVTLYPQAKQSGIYLTAVADTSGRATFAAVPAGPWAVHADEGDVNASTGYWGATDQVTVPKGGHVEAAMTLRPDAYPFAAVGPSSVQAASADGRTLEFSLRLFTFPDFVLTDVRDCVPDAGNDAPTFKADCVEGAPGVDLAYEAADTLDPPLTTIPGGSPKPFSVAVLMDQSGEMSLNDPSDLRLFALKYFLTTLQEDDRVLIGAFSADDTGTGHLSALPDTPVTVLPVGSTPAFAAADRAFFPSIDLLGMQEGGAAPLYASIDRMLELTAAGAAPVSRRAVVVLTDGLDRTCGSPAKCEAALQTLIAKSRATGIAIFTIGVRSANEIDRRAISELTDASGGASLWLFDFQLGRAFGALSSLLDGSAEVTEWRFRIQSSNDGTFRSGRTVLGTAWAGFTSCDGLSCGFSSGDLVPFAVRIP